ncbi:MAG TPA: hypothetical protein VKP10_14045 [Gemmatimonadales bacterium]|nr:hypothetical protein [Gemmatimonadales bacterium]
MDYRTAPRVTPVAPEDGLLLARAVVGAPPALPRWVRDAGH